MDKKALDDVGPLDLVNQSSDETPDAENTDDTDQDLNDNLESNAPAADDSLMGDDTNSPESDLGQPGQTNDINSIDYDDYDILVTHDLNDLLDDQDDMDIDFSRLT